MPDYSYELEEGYDDDLIQLESDWSPGMFSQSSQGTLDWLSRVYELLVEERKPPDKILTFTRNLRKYPK